MIAILTYLAAAMLGVYFYGKGKYSAFIIILFFILFSGFGFLTDILTTAADISIAMCLSCAMLLRIKDPSTFSIKNDPIAKLIVIILVYQTIVMLKTIATGAESLLYSIKVWRFDLMYLCYFAFRRIPISETKKAFKVFLPITGIAGFFYLMQFAGVTGILNMDMTKALDSGDDIARLVNAPGLSVAMLIYVIYTNEKIKFRALWLIFLAALVILPMVRGVILSLVASILIYHVTTGDFKRFKRIILWAGLIAILFLPILTYRFWSDKRTNDNAIFNDIGYGLSVFSKSLDGDLPLVMTTEGTFAFRVALALERLMYQVDNNGLLFGYGTIHEDSPNNHFDFSFRSRKTVNGNLVYQQIDTGDIALVSHIFRYGLVYLALYVCFLVMSLKALHRNASKNPMFEVGFVLLLSMIIAMPGVDMFTPFAFIAMALLLIAQASKLELDNKNRPHQSC
jgi:hypothetical protein